MSNTLTPEQLVTLRNMPEAVHYPNRAKKFDFADSEVIAFIQRQFDQSLHEAVQTFERSRRAKHIVYDPTIKAWMGAELMKPQPAEVHNDTDDTE